jgi:hypothetical protein
MNLADAYGWYNVLRECFKISHNNALHALKNTVYGRRDVSSRVAVRSYAQEIIRVCDVLETQYSLKDKLDCNGCNLDAGMRLNVAVPTSTTVLPDWLQVRHHIRQLEGAVGKQATCVRIPWPPAAINQPAVQSQLSQQSGSRNLPIRQNGYRSHGAHERYESRKVAAFRAAKSPTSS